MQQKKVFISWSGGKDSYLSLLKARAAGLEPAYLLTYINGEQDCSMSHGLPLPLLQKQARALGLPHLAEPVTWESYAAGFHRAVTALREKGLTGGVFGDINLPAHRQWVEEACARAGVTPYLPLWGMAEEEVLETLLAAGAELLIVALRADLLAKKWLGTILGREFIRELMAGGISPCGEKGEYHTMAVSGPLFKERVEVSFRGTRPDPGGLVLFLDYLL